MPPFSWNIWEKTWPNNRLVHSFIVAAPLSKKFGSHHWIDSEILTWGSTKRYIVQCIMYLSLLQKAEHCLLNYQEKPPGRGEYLFTGIIQKRCPSIGDYCKRMLMSFVQLPVVTFDFLTLSIGYIASRIKLSFPSHT